MKRFDQPDSFSDVLMKSDSYLNSLTPKSKLCPSKHYTKYTSNSNEKFQLSSRTLLPSSTSNQQAEDWQSQFFKTKLCPYYLGGRCINDSRCRFAHSPRELRPLPNLHRTKLCESYIKKEHCHQPDCPFAHNPCELRTSSHTFYKVTLCNFYKKGRCWNGVHCRFAHGASELQYGSETITHSQTIDASPSKHHPMEQSSPIMNYTESLAAAAAVTTEDQYKSSSYFIPSEHETPRPYDDGSSSNTSSHSSSLSNSNSSSSLCMKTPRKLYSPDLLYDTTTTASSPLDSEFWYRSSKDPDSCYTEETNQKQSTNFLGHLIQGLESLQSLFPQTSPQHHDSTIVSLEPYDDEDKHAVSQQPSLSCTNLPSLVKLINHSTFIPDCDTQKSTQELHRHHHSCFDPCKQFDDGSANKQKKDEYNSLTWKQLLHLMDSEENMHKPYPTYPDIYDSKNDHLLPTRQPNHLLSHYHQTPLTIPYSSCHP